jgi:type IV pilus assembly protein PilA
MNRKGFTLIELMIVIAIIAILAAIIIPNVMVVVSGGGSSQSNIEVRDQQVPQIVDQQKEKTPESPVVKSIEGENKKL